MLASKLASSEESIQVLTAKFNASVATAQGLQQNLDAVTQKLAEADQEIDTQLESFRGLQNEHSQLQDENLQVGSLKTALEAQVVKLQEQLDAAMSTHGDLSKRTSIHK